LWCLTILTISKKRVPLVSSNPFFKPALEKGWQGNPASKMSCLGILSSSILFFLCT
jgi:hypothetical protein